MADRTQNQAAESSSFITGFTIGLFTGAAGYYLFATEKGSKLRKQLADEWDGAREHLAEEGVIENAHVSLREFLMEIFTKAFSSETTNNSKTYQHVLLADELDESKKKAREAANKAKKDSSKRFKGV